MTLKYYIMSALFCAGLLAAQEPAAPAAEASTTSSMEDALSEDHKEALEEMARFTVAMEQIRRLHVEGGGQEDLGYKELVDAAIAGMMGRLDRFSSYVSGRDVEDLKVETQGEFGGIGAVVSSDGRWIRIVSAIEEGPSWDAGLQPQDQVIEIDGESVRGWTVQQAVDKLRGPPGSEVKLRLRRPGENRVFEVSLARQVIRTRSVRKHVLLEPGIGYVRVSSFADPTADLLRRELTALDKAGAESLILDLRGNPGGLLRAAVEVSALFLPKDSLVVKTKGREGEVKSEYRTQTRPHRLDPKLVVLINRGSASASEIVSGALQDSDRAEIIGEKSFGKASVQSILPLPDGSALRLTTATYYTPSAREIHGKGIEPDERVRFSLGRLRQLQMIPASERDWAGDPQVQKALEWLRADDSSN